MKISLLLVFALITAGCAHARGSLPVIDAHVHTSFDGIVDESVGTTNTREGIQQEFRDANVVGAVSMMARDGTGYDEELAKQGVTFCVGLPENPDYAAIEAGLQAGKYGCIKIYLGYVFKFANDPSYEPAYALAAKYGVPVVFHTGDVWNKDGKVKYADPLTIDEVAVDHRKVTFVIAHIGNPWIQSAAEVAYKNYNVYLEGSAVVVGDLDRFTTAELDEQAVKSIRWVFNYIENPKKLLFGTDWPLVPIHQYLKVFMRAIPVEHWSKVFHDNAVRVYKMKTPLLEPEEKASAQD